MGNTLTQIAEQLRASDKKKQLIYAFNGVGKTRLSREFKELIEVNPNGEDGDENSEDLELSQKIFFIIVPLLKTFFIGIMT